MMMEKYFKKERKIQPNSVNKFQSLGIYYFKVGKYQKAIECFKKVLIIEPDHMDSKDKIKLLNMRIKNINQEFQKNNKMDEYIKAPLWPKNVNNLRYYSPNIQIFLDTYQINEIKYIDLNYLRSYYKQDKEKALDLIDEFALRGFSFLSKEKMNVLPNIKEKDTGEYIVATKSGDNFKNIKFNELGLSNFIERFKVKNDLFFTNVQIENFLHINKNISLILLKNEFINNGFILSNTSSQNILIKKDVLVYNKDEEEKNKYLIDDIFNEGMFNSFREYCNKNNLRYLDDLENCNFNNLMHEKRNIGIKKQNKIKERYYDFIGKTKNKLLINDVFKESVFQSFREYCNKNNLHYLDDLEGYNFNNLMHDKCYIGVKKLKKIKEKYYYFIENFKNNSKRTNLSVRDEKIEEIFNGNMFGIFRNYCKKKNLIYMKNLSGFNFHKLLNIKGFGTRRVELIIEKWMEFSKKYNINVGSVSENILLKDLLIENLNENQQIYENIINLRVHNDFKDLDIEFIEKNGVEKKYVIFFKRNNIIKIGDLANKNITLINKNKKGVFYKLAEKLKFFEMPMKSDLSNGLNILKLNRRYYNIYKKRITLNQTLEKIGKEENLTRERIRQIANKINKKFIYYFTRNFAPYLREKYKNKIYFNYSDLKQYFYNDEDSLVAKKLLMENNFSNIYYFKEIDKFLILLNKDLHNIRKKLNLIIKENLPEIFIFHNYWLDIANMLEENEISFINESDFKKYLKSLKYNEYNNWIIKGTPSLRKLYNIILEKYFTKGLCLDGKGIINIRNIARREFGVKHLPKNDRAIVSPICDENVLCGKKTYISIKNVDISIELLEIIRKFIEDSNINSVPIEYIFTKYKNKLDINSNIDNKYFLYGVLRHYYSKEFNFRRAAFIEKKKTGNIRTHKILEKYLLEKNRIVRKEEIKNELKWSDISIINAILLNQKILVWDRGKVIHVSLIKINDKTVNCLRKILDETMINNNGYANAGFLYKKIKFQLNDIIRENKIKNSFSFFSVLEYIFKSKYYFRRPHILNYNPGKEFTTIDLFYRFIKENPKFSYYQMNNYFNKLGFPDGSISGFFYKVSKNLLQISIDEYILKDNIKINDKLFEEIRNTVDKKFKDKEYLSLMGFINFKDFPDIGLEWNPYLLKSIIINYIKDYRVIEKGSKDKRYSHIILVKDKSYIRNIVDLILFIIENEYRDKENMTIAKIENYLQLENIIHKSLPNEFYESTLVEVDKLGRVKILGELEKHEF